MGFAKKRTPPDGSYTKFDISSYKAEVLSDIESVWKWAADANPILIDVPIGLHDAGTEPRQCDIIARRLLGRPRSSSVFPPPCRPALKAGNREEASRINEALTGRKINAQTWGIFPKIREVDAFLRAERSRNTRLREVHPELLFWALNHRKPMCHRKATTLGRKERLEVLSRHAPSSFKFFESEKGKLRVLGAEAHDLLDALAAVVAMQASGGELRALPDSREIDSHGLQMQMLYPHVLD